MKYDYTIKSHYRVLAKTGERYYVPSYTESRNVPLQWQIYFTMAIYGQMRRGEMCALTWNDIDFEKHIISINKSAREVKTLGRIVKEPKTRAGIRDLVMPADLFDLLKKWKKEQTELCISLGTAWQGHRTTTNVDGTKDHFDENTLFIRMDNGLPIDLSTPYHKFEEIISYITKSVQKKKTSFLKSGCMICGTREQRYCLEKTPISKRYPDDSDTAKHPSPWTSTGTPSLRTTRKPLKRSPRCSEAEPKRKKPTVRNNHRRFFLLRQKVWKLNMHRQRITNSSNDGFL